MDFAWVIPTPKDFDYASHHAVRQLQEVLHEALVVLQDVHSIAPKSATPSVIRV